MRTWTRRCSSTERIRARPYDARPDCTVPRPYETYRTHHQSRRLPGYDYAQPAAYFVTLCTHDRACLFGTVRDGMMHPNEIGRAVDEEWRRSEDRRAEIVLDAYVVMPNHLHGIVLIVPPDADPTTARDPHGYDLNLRLIANPGVASQRAATLQTDRGGRVNVRLNPLVRSCVPSNRRPQNASTCCAARPAERYGNVGTTTASSATNANGVPSADT